MKTLRLLSVAAIMVLLGYGSAFAAPPQYLSRRIPLELSWNLRPHIHLRLGRHDGWFLVDTGTTASQVDYKIFGGRVGEARRMAGSSIPEFEAQRFDIGDTSGLEGPRKERLIGVIGADIMALRTIELHYDTERPYMTISAQSLQRRPRCTSDSLRYCLRKEFIHVTLRLEEINSRKRSPIPLPVRPVLSDKDVSNVLYYVLHEEAPGARRFV
jgi:hypothetical protein